jgi:hypothetical protein
MSALEMECAIKQKITEHKAAATKSKIFSTNANGR